MSAHAYVYRCAHATPQYVCGGQRTTCRTQLSYCAHRSWGTEQVGHQAWQQGLLLLSRLTRLLLSTFMFVFSVLFYILMELIFFLSPSL